MVSGLWTRFRQRIWAGDPAFVAVAGEDVVYNAIATYYSRNRVTLPRCTFIIRHMLDSDFCKPTARTWGIVLMGFMKHGDFEGARKIKAWMTDEGVEPDEDTRRIVADHLPEAYKQSEASAILNRYETSVQPATGDEQPEIFFGELEPGPASDDDPQTAKSSPPPQPNDFLMIKLVARNSK